MKEDLTKNNSGGNNKLTDFDVCELFISCHKVFAETASKLDFDKEVVFSNGLKLWKETIRNLEEYRKGQSKDPNR
jgi:hypothetical protein